MKAHTMSIIKNITKRINLFLFPTVLIFFQCESGKSRLPVLGMRTWNGSDTIYHRIAPFQLVDQDSAIFSNASLKGKIYVADFFFTSCRTICPIMKVEMKRVYEATADMEEVELVSHTIDPEYDDVKRLHEFARRLGVSSRWHFLTGKKDSIYRLARESYFATAKEGDSSSEKFIHSGTFTLIDKQGRIRGAYDGTSEEDVNRLILDIKKLRRE